MRPSGGRGASWRGSGQRGGGSDLAPNSYCAFRRSSACISLASASYFAASSSSAIRICSSVTRAAMPRYRLAWMSRSAATSMSAKRPPPAII